VWEAALWTGERDCGRQAITRDASSFTRCSSPSFAGHVLAGPLHGERRGEGGRQAANGQHERPNHKPPGQCTCSAHPFRTRVRNVMPWTVTLAVNNVKPAAVNNAAYMALALCQSAGQARPATYPTPSSPLVCVFHICVRYS
jgi:hypothetical protein